MHNLQLTVEEVMQRHDRNIIERREKQKAALAATQKIIQQLALWQSGARGDITAEEMTAIIFTEFENVPSR